MTGHYAFQLLAPATGKGPAMSDTQTISTLKGLVIDGVNKANSGHPGGAMSSMDFAYLLFTEYLKFDPDNVNWLGRDRFILSAGHESMLMYALLHMQGVLPMDELKKFRQLDSKTPGHPENFITDGVECTTGPLGQGAAMSVGFAIAAKHMSAKLDEELFQQKTWVLLGDGCMQEGVTLGAASMAGHLQLNNLIWFYDRNKVQISGNIDRAYSDDAAKVFEGFGWEVIELDGHNHTQLRQAMDQAKKQQNKPLLIIGDTVIGKGAFSLEGQAKTHGAPLPAEERLKTKEKLGLPADKEFFVAQETMDHFRRNFNSLRDQVAQYNQKLKEKLAANNEFKKLYDSYFSTEDFSHLSQLSWDKAKPVATRNAFGDIIEAWADEIPNLIGGSADLEPSNMTGAFAKKVGEFTAETPDNRNISFGVREFPMSAVCNGISLFGGMIPFDATFLSFADYSRPALRLGAIQNAKVIHEFSHDSFYLGEDGPTHQPVEHIMSLRMIPDFYVMRPADATETEIMMREALKLNTGSAICLTRQKLPHLEHSRTQFESAAKGAWAVLDTDKPDLVLIATGSEVATALKAAELLKGVKTKVISMPCWELFDKQTRSYQKELLTNCPKKVSIEAGVTLGWQKYTGSDGLNIGLDHYGKSAPAGDLEKEYGFTPAAISEKVKAYLSQ